MVETIQLCEGCKLPSDRAWKTYKDKNYGLVWQEVGICRHCWGSWLEKVKKQEKQEQQALTYREAF